MGTMLMPTNRVLPTCLKGTAIMATLNQTLATLVTKASKDRQQGMTSTKALLDAMYSDGVQPDDLMAPKGNVDRTFYDSLKDAIVAGFSKTAQALLAADVKSLDEEKKVGRMYWQTQIGTTLKDWRKGLKARIERANAAESSEGAGTRKASPEAIIRRELASLIERAEKLESSTINDLPAFIAALKAALARVPA
jgi:hypothetical protein